MAYTPTTWVNNTTPALAAAPLNKLEAGVQDAAADADNALAALAQLTVEYFQDLMRDTLRAGTNVALAYDDVGGLLTISSTGTGGGTGSVTVAGITDATSAAKTFLLAADNAARLQGIGAQPAGNYVLTSELTAAVDSQMNTRRDAINGFAGLDANAKIAIARIPEAAITRGYPVASQSAMLALTGVDPGDIAVRSDNNLNYILQALPASTLSNWLQMGGGSGGGGTTPAVVQAGAVHRIYCANDVQLPRADPITGTPYPATASVDWIKATRPTSPPALDHDMWIPMPLELQ